MPTPERPLVVEVGLSSSLAWTRTILQEMLGPRYRVAAGLPDLRGVMVVDAASDVRRVRSTSRELRIIALLDDPTNVAIVERIEAGADLCLADPGLPGLAAHIRALAAHRPCRRFTSEQLGD